MTGATDDVVGERSVVVVVVVVVDVDVVTVVVVVLILSLTSSGQRHLRHGKLAHITIF